MRPLSSRFTINPYLAHLTDDEPDWRWVSTLMWHCLLLWVANLVWAWLTALTISRDTFAAASTLGLSLSLLAFSLLLVGFVAAGTRLASAETQNGHLADLRQTDISQTTLRWSLVMATLYRARYWLVWIIGVCPFFLWSIFLWSKSATITHGPNLDCMMTPLGFSFCYGDDSVTLNNLLQMILWFPYLTMSMLGIMFLAIQTSIGLVMNGINTVFSAVAALSVNLPLLLVVIVLVLPEGIVFTHTPNLLGVICLVLGALPPIASFCVQRLLLSVVFKR